MKLFTDYFLEDDKGFTCFKNTPELVVWEKKVRDLVIFRVMICMKGSYRLNILIY